QPSAPGSEISAARPCISAGEGPSDGTSCDRRRKRDNSYSTLHPVSAAERIPMTRIGELSGELRRVSRRGVGCEHRWSRIHDVVMAKRLGDRVVLKAGVESVRRKDGRFLGTTRRGTWRRKAGRLAVPPPVPDRIEFHPPPIARKNGR